MIALDPGDFAARAVPVESDLDLAAMLAAFDNHKSVSNSINANAMQTAAFSLVNCFARMAKLEMAYFVAFVVTFDLAMAFADSNRDSVGITVKNNTASSFGIGGCSGNQANAQRDSGSPAGIIFLNMILPFLGLLNIQPGVSNCAFR